MSKVIENGLAHFRAKLNRHLKIVNACYAEIARLEALQQGSNPTSRALDEGGYCACEDKEKYSVVAGVCIYCKRPRQ